MPASAQLSVVIPTLNRREAVLHTLERIAAQRVESAVEVIVVDNGSDDGTPRAVADLHPEVRLMQQPVRGPSAARNLGVAQAQAPLVLFLGDDMAPADDGLLARHLDFHTARPDPLHGLLGRATWRPDRPVSPFMRWLENGGPQFDFTRLEAGPVSPATHLITAHVSLKREVLEPFDERFAYAAVEDAELGLRLARKGLRLEYRPELLVHHDHPTTLDDAVRRMRRVGESAWLMHSIHAGETTSFPRPNARWRLYPAAAVVARAARAVPALRERAWGVLMLEAYARGYRSAARGRRSA